MRVAAGQMTCTVGHVLANIQSLRDSAERAKAAGAEWIVFPEMADTGYVMPVIWERAGCWNTGAVPALQTAARELALGIICGVSERDGPCVFNTQVVIDGRGEIIARYRKTHLFALSPIEEDKCCTPGTEMVAVSVGDFRFGLGICYDLRFPEFYRTLALRHGANVLVISSAWPFPRMEHLRTLAMARAIENQSYVILANRVGTDAGVTFCGNSAIIDPAGEIIAAASAEREEVVVADISAPVLESVRSRMPVFAHRRPEVYNGKCIDPRSKAEGVDKVSR